MSPRIEQLSTELAGVPVIQDQTVVGYVVFKLSAIIDRSRISRAVTDLQPFLSNAGFRASYEFAARGSLKVRDDDVQALTQRIAEFTTQALGEKSVLAIRVEHFDFVRGGDIRAAIPDLRQ